jgi:four helix bundle protein
VVVAEQLLTTLLQSQKSLKIINQESCQLSVDGYWLKKILMKKEYTELEVWIEARKLVNMIYEKTKNFPKEEIYGLTNQIRRCSISIPSNIAEGLGRRTAQDTIQFLHISRGSLYELETQIYLAFDQKYINEIDLETFLNQILACKKLLNGFINYFKSLQNGN